MGETVVGIVSNRSYWRYCVSLHPYYGKDIYLVVLCQRDGFLECAVLLVLLCDYQILTRIISQDLDR